MEEIVNFYLNIIARLKEKQTEKLVYERLLPNEYVVLANKGETRKQKKLFKKSEKQRNQIEKGYYKGIEDSIKIIYKVFKDVQKNEEKNNR